LAGADNFAVQLEKAGTSIEWLNSYARQRNIKFEVRSLGYTLTTAKFGNFEVIAWKGDWSTARNLIQKVSRKLNIKVIEAGYKDRNLLTSILGGKEYAKVYSNGNYVGQVKMGNKSGRWVVEESKLG